MLLKHKLYPLDLTGQLDQGAAGQASRDEFVNGPTLNKGRNIHVGFHVHMWLSYIYTVPDVV